jgi:multiple sugar transport system substrate-binding protein
VSTATVSRVLNGGPVTGETRETVERAIHDLGYRRNSVAHSLVTGRSGVVGVLVPDVVGPLYADIMRGIEEALRPHGMQAMLVTDNRDRERERASIELLLSRQIEGLIDIGSQLDDDELHAVTDGLPVVLIQRESDGDHPALVSLDNRHGIDVALRHLLERGHRDIAHIAGVRKDGGERQRAFVDLMETHALDSGRIFDGDSTEACGEEAASWLLDLPDVTAVVCTNDRTAFGLFRPLKRLGRSIPDDISVVGFDDLPWGAYLDPPLTTIRQPGREMGRLAAERLLSGWSHASPSRVWPTRRGGDRRDAIGPKNGWKAVNVPASRLNGVCMKRLITVGLALLLTGFVVAQEIDFWTSEDQPSRMEKQMEIAANFEAATGIVVNVIPVSEADMVTRSTAAFAAGDLPDVMNLSLANALGLASEGILDIEANNEVIESLGRDTFAEGPLNLGAVDDGVVGVPSSGWTQMLVYRKDLFDAAGLAAPTDFDSIQAAIEALHDPPNMFGFVAATDVSQDYMMQVLEHLFLANGMSLLDDAGNVDVDNAQTIETLEFYKILADASPEGNLYWLQSRELFLAGQAAMIVWSPFIMDELAGLRDSVPVTVNDDPTSSALAEDTGFITRGGAAWASVSYWGITVDADTGPAQQWVEYLASEGYADWLSFAPEGFFPSRSGSTPGATDFVDLWSNLPVGVDRKAPLSDFYPADVIADIVAGLEVANLWGVAQGQRDLVGRLYGTRALMQLEVEALQ